MSLSFEQKNTTESISKTLKGQHLALFEALIERFPVPTPPDQLAKDHSRLEHAALSVCKNELNSKIDAFYKTPEGRRADWVIKLNNHPGRGSQPHGYYLKCEPNEGFYLRRFWGHHLNKEKPIVPTHISYTSVRFFRHPQRFFFRHLDINDDTPDEAISQMAQEVPALNTVLGGKTFPGAMEAGLRDTYYFTTTGEVACILKLTKLLEAYGIENHYSLPITARWNIPRAAEQAFSNLYATRANLILLGNARSHPAVRALQEDPFYTRGWRWRIGPKHVEPARSNEGDSYPDHKVTPDGTRLVYAVLSRMPSAIPNRVITIIAGNNGRVYEGLVELLTSDNSLRGLYRDKLKWPDDQPLPERFQIIFSVRLGGSDQRIEEDATFVAAHPEQWPAHGVAGEHKAT